MTYRHTYPAHLTPVGLLSNVEVRRMSLVKTGKIPPIIMSPCLNKLGMSNLPSTSQPLTVSWQRTIADKKMTVCSTCMFAEYFFKLQGERGLITAEPRHKMIWRLNFISTGTWRLKFNRVNTTVSHASSNTHAFALSLSHGPSLIPYFFIPTVYDITQPFTSGRAQNHVKT